MQPFRPWVNQVWPRSKIARNLVNVCMHGYLSNGYLNSLSNSKYEKLVKITSHRTLVYQPWITTKIATSILQVGVHSSLPNAWINLQSNFNFEKLVKSETLLCNFVKVGIKGGENILERHESSCIRLPIRWPFKSMIKF